MPIKNELELERIFSYAAALDESGRQKNAIWAWKNVIFILNHDKTIILRFEIQDEVFADPLGLYAADYSSSNFSFEGEFVIFYKDEKGGWESKIIHKIPSGSFQEVEDLFYKFFPDLINYPYISFHKEALELLDENLSHIEFKSIDNKLQIIQRDIYSGKTIILERPPKTGLQLINYDDNVPNQLLPIGMRMNDFLSLFNFNDKVKIYFPIEENPMENIGNTEYFIVEGTFCNMYGVVGGCLYDDIGTIQTIKEKENGWKEQENRNSEQKADRKNPGEIDQSPILLRRRPK